MAKSRTSAPLNPPSGSIRIPARTPGTIGFYDQADPNVTTLLGDTPGTLGYGDHADPNLPKATLNAIAVRLPDGTAVSLGSDGKALDPDDGPFVYADYAAIKESVGDGFCVPLVQQKSKVMNTKILAIVDASMFRRGYASAHLVAMQMTTNITLC